MPEALPVQTQVGMAFATPAPISSKKQAISLLACAATYDFFNEKPLKLERRGVSIDHLSPYPANAGWVQHTNYPVLRAIPANAGWVPHTNYLVLRDIPANAG